MKPATIGIFTLLGLALALVVSFGYRHFAHHFETEQSQFSYMAQTGTLYDVTFQPKTGDAKIGPISSFILTLKTKDGKPVTGASVVIDGGMKAHGHGLPTKPAIVGEIADGVYEVDGVKFSMAGNWHFNFDIDAGAGKELITVTIYLD